MQISYEKRKSLSGLMFVSPFILGTILFFLYPLITSIRLSFSKLQSAKGLVMQFIGLDNYVRAFTWDLQFMPNLLESVKSMLIYTPLIVVFSMIFAIMINYKFALRGFFRVAFFLPFLLGSGYVMNQLLGMNIQATSLDISRGILVPEQLALIFGPGITNWIYIYLSIITIILWKSGVQILLFLSGLQSIPESLYEASKCDGATEWERYWKITLPMLSPMILLNIVFTIIMSFIDMTNNAMSYIYNTTFKNPVQFEYGAAMSWVYFAIVLLVIGGVFVIMGRLSYSGDNK